MYGFDVRRPPQPGQALPARRVRGLPAAQGLPAAGPRGQALARPGRRRADARGPRAPSATDGRRRAPSRRGQRRRGGHELMAVTDHSQQLTYIAAQAADARVNVELQTEDMTLNLGPQHPATHGTLRIVAKLDGEQVVEAEVVCGYMHRGYEKLTEFRTYPAGHDPDQPDRLAVVVRQRGPVHPRRRGAHGDRGAAPGPVHPDDPLRAQPHRQRHPVHRRDGRAARRHHAGVLRLPRPRARPQPDRVGHRRAVPPQLRPHRRAQGRPAQGLGRRDPRRHDQDPRPTATSSRTCSWATRSSRPAPAASA